MFNSFSRSWALGKQSWAVLRSDKQLVLLPLISSVACLVVLASFALPVFFTVDWEAVSKQPNGAQTAAQSPLYYVVLFAFYFTNYAVIAFFNSALIACAMRKFEGEDASVGAGLRAAAARLPQILGWALVSATVGVVLRAIAERSGIIGRIVIGLVGFVWTIATYFVVPVLVMEGVGPIEAIKRSAGIIRKTWGETLVVNVGLGAMSFIGSLLAFAPLLIGLGITIATESIWPFAIGGAATLVMLVLLALITSTLKMILVAALYRYAATGLVPEQFDGQLLKQMFKKKGEKS